MLGLRTWIYSTRTLTERPLTRPALSLALAVAASSRVTAMKVQKSVTWILPIC